MGFCFTRADLKLTYAENYGKLTKTFFGRGGKGGGVNRLIDSEKLIEVYLLLPIRYRLNKFKKTMKKQKNKKQKNMLHYKTPSEGI